MESEEESNEKSHSSSSQTQFKIKFKNPLITKFSGSSHFVYDIFEYKNYFQFIKDRNRIKLSSNKYNFLENLILKIDIKTELKKIMSL